MNPDITQALVELVLAIIGLATLAITGYLVPWLRAKLGAERMEQGRRVARTAVTAAEQIGGLNHVKYQNALQRARSLAEAKGLHLTDVQWQTLIEATVGMTKEWQRTIIPASTDDTTVTVSMPSERGTAARKATTP